MSVNLRLSAEDLVLQVGDFLSVRILGKQDAFRVLKKTLNFAPDKIELAIRENSGLIAERILEEDRQSEDDAEEA